MNNKQPIRKCSGEKPRRILDEFVHHYFYKLIGKLTDFLQLQEFSLRILPVTSPTF
jgi:hypothetical protein